MAREPNPLVLANQLARRESIRQEELSAVSRRYSPWLHLGATTSIGITIIAMAIWQASNVKAYEWLILPGTFLFANGFEWRAHRNILHRPLPIGPLVRIYERHTPMHHMVFTEDDMSIRSSQDLVMVLMPALGVFGIVAICTPLAVATATLISANAGWLFLASASTYVVFYEISHLSYHLPKESWVGRRWLVRKMRVHHSRHHNPKLMQKWNFNVTIPLFDWIKGTIAKADTTEATAPSEAQAAIHSTAKNEV